MSVKVNTQGIRIIRYKECLRCQLESRDKKWHIHSCSYGPRIPHKIKLVLN